MSKDNSESGGPTGPISIDRRGAAHQVGHHGSVPRSGWEDTFLEAFRNSGVVRTSLLAAGISWPTLTRHLQDNPGFREAYEYAKREAIALLETAAWNRAIKGVKRTKGVYFRGERIAEETQIEYSDTLLMFLLRSLDPERFREQVDHNYTMTVMRKEAERIAREQGLDPQDVMNEAERIIYGKG